MVITWHKCVPEQIWVVLAWKPHCSYGGGGSVGERGGVEGAEEVLPLSLMSP